MMADREADRRRGLVHLPDSWYEPVCTCRVDRERVCPRHGFVPIVIEEEKMKETFKAGDRVQLKGCDHAFVIAGIAPDDGGWANLIWFDESTCFFRREQCVPLAALKKVEDR